MQQRAMEDKEFTSRVVDGTLPSGISNQDAVDRCRSITASLSGSEDQEAIYQCLCASRQLLKNRRESKRLFDEGALTVYLEVAETKEFSQKTIVMALNCLVNSLFMNPEAFMTFSKLEGVDRVLALCKGEACVLGLQRMFRIMNFCVQRYRTTCAQDPSVKTQLETLVRTLSDLTINCLIYCVRGQSKGRFPGQTRPVVDLCLEVLTLQIILGAEIGSDNLKGDNQTDSESFTQLGMVLVEMLLLPLDLRYVFELKKKVISVLTLMPNEYSYFLSANKAFDSIIEVLEREIRITFLNSRSSDDIQVRLLPILVVLNTAAENCEIAKYQIEKIVFPPVPEEVLQEREACTDKKKNTEPEYAPPGGLLYNLLRLMGCSSATVSRITNELLWNLSDKNSNLFIRRTGLGNAVGLLQLKGLINLS
mmetsp:Transcript_20786/g.34385  ORF Transcript_20786/g.34385 Transcript_20786/m.34385 type:complete len:421 (-) Transcript_20786:1353-2615(-)